MLTNKKVIVLFFLFLFFAVSFLVLKGEKDEKKEIYSFWEIYFEKIDSEENLDFFIVNYSDNFSFFWEVFLDGEKKQEGQIDVSRKSKGLVDIDEEALSDWQRASIRVRTQDEFKELVRVKK